MPRTTEAQLLNMVASISRQTGRLHALDSNGSGYRLARYSTDRDGRLSSAESTVIDRLSAGMMREALGAYLAGMQAMADSLGFATDEKQAHRPLTMRERRFAVEWALTPAQVLRLVQLAMEAADKNAEGTGSEDERPFINAHNALADFVKETGRNFLAPKWSVEYTGLYPCLKLTADYTCPIDSRDQYKAGRFVELPYPEGDEA